LVSIRAILPNATLLCAEPLATLQLGDSYSVAQCLNERGIVRERARLLLSMGGRAPFRIAQDLFGDPDPGITVYRHCGNPVEGIGLAELYGGLPVSFAIPPWLVATIQLDVEQLTTDVEHRWIVETRHASVSDHVRLHRLWLISLRCRDIVNAVDLYNRRNDLFPSLEFGRNLQSNLQDLQPPAFWQVVQYLCRLDESVEQWDPKTAHAPEYPPHTTDEHESRKRLCYFPDTNGVSTCCSWHGRFTPGPGRIHFKVEADPKRAIVAYIGRKL
jgi:hypothetical protein